MNPRTVVILGDDDVRTQVREALRLEQHIDIIGELCALQPRHVDYLSIVQPDVVVVDGASRSINPLIVIAELRALVSPPRVVMVLAGGLVDFRAASRPGVEAIVTTREALRLAVLAPVRSDIRPELEIAA